MSGLNMGAAAAGLGNGLAQGMNAGVNMGNAINQNRREQERWTREQAEKTEQTELMAGSGTAHSLLAMKPGAKVDINFPLPKTFTMMLKGKQPTQVEATKDGFQVYDANGPIGTVPRAQLEFMAERFDYMLSGLYGMKHGGRQGGQSGAEFIRGKDTPTGVWSPETETFTPIRPTSVQASDADREQAQEDYTEARAEIAEYATLQKRQGNEKTGIYGFRETHSQRINNALAKLRKAEAVLGITPKSNEETIAELAGGPVAQPKGLQIPGSLPPEDQTQQGAASGDMADIEASLLQKVRNGEMSAADAQAAWQRAQQNQQGSR